MAKVYGAGSIQQTRNHAGEKVQGSWQLRLDLGWVVGKKDGAKKERKRITRTYRGNKKDAQRELGRFRSEIEQGFKPQSGTTIFSDYATQWLESNRASGEFAASTLARQAYQLEKMTGYFGDTEVGDIDTANVRLFFIHLNQAGLGSAVRAQVAIMLNQIFRRAAHDGLIVFNPCERLEKNERPSAPRTRKDRALDAHGVIRLLSAFDAAEEDTDKCARSEYAQLVSNHAHVCGARLALAAGLRRGEVLGLEWADIDLDNQTLCVKRSMCVKSNALKGPKSASGERMITLDGQTVEHLRRWRVMQSEYLLQYGIAQNGRTPVVSNERGQRIEANHYNRWWVAFRERYGFDGLRFHDLRHTSASLLASAQINPAAIAARLGHSNVAFTLNTYVHPSTEDDRLAASVIGRFTSEGLPGTGQVVGL